MSTRNLLAFSENYKIIFVVKLTVHGTFTLFWRKTNTGSSKRWHIWSDPTGKEEQNEKHKREIWTKTPKKMDKRDIFETQEIQKVDNNCCLLLGYEEHEFVMENMSLLVPSRTTNATWWENSKPELFPWVFRL